MKVNLTAQKAELQTELRILKAENNPNNKETIEQIEQNIERLELARKRNQVQSNITDKAKKINKRVNGYNLLDRNKEKDSNDPEDTEFNPFARIMTITSTSSFEYEDILKQKEKLKELEKREKEQEELRERQKQRGYNFNQELPEESSLSQNPIKDEIEEIHSQFDLDSFHLGIKLDNFIAIFNLFLLQKQRHR